MFKKVKDLLGQKFNMLTVIARAANDSSGNARWLCKCDCGKEKTVIGFSLLKNETYSCGCVRRKGVAKNRNILLGKRFGNLVVIEEVEIGSQRRVVCKCDCGNVVSRLASVLTNHQSSSCGCARNLGATLKHGMYGTPTYCSWHMMIQRTCNPNDPRWQDYGGRGITVCKRWRESFTNFYADMGIRPVGKTLDRINTNGNYEPSNCKWSTPSEQQRNRRCRLNQPTIL